MKTTPPPSSALALFLASALALPACKAAPPKEEPRPPSGEAWVTPSQLAQSHITVEPLGERDIESRFAACGRITFDDARVGHVYSPATGRVVRIEAPLGARVRKGAPLAVIDSPDVGQAFSDLARAQADVLAADQEAHRQEELTAGHAGTQRELEGARAALAKARSELGRAQLKARLYTMDRASDRTNEEIVLRAPIDGEIIARNVSPGAEVQGQYAGGAAVELFTLGALDKVWLLAEVFEMDLAHVRLGAQVEAQVVAWPGRVFKGRIDWVSPMLDPVTRTARVRCSLANPSRELLPEMYATLSIVTGEKKALALPKTALFHLGERTFVFVEVGLTESGLHRFVRRAVRLEESEGADLVAVVEGLKAGEQVATSGGILLAGML